MSNLLNYKCLLENEPTVYFEEKVVKDMKTIVVSIHNGLLAEGIMRMLEESGEFRPVRNVSTKQGGVIQSCQALSADLWLAEVSYALDSTIERRLEQARELHRTVPRCKIAFFCDENSSPELAHEVKNAKKDGFADGFFYASVTAKYLVAALSVL